MGYRAGPVSIRASGVLGRRDGRITPSKSEEFGDRRKSRRTILLTLSAERRAFVEPRAAIPDHGANVIAKWLVISRLAGPMPAVMDAAAPKTSLTIQPFRRTTNSTVQNADVVGRASEDPLKSEFPPRFSVRQEGSAGTRRDMQDPVCGWVLATRG